MDTTIQISKELLSKLQSMKLHTKESYENLIWDLLEDRMEFSEETKKAIEDYKKDIKGGHFEKFRSLEEVKKGLGINV